MKLLGRLHTITSLPTLEPVLLEVQRCVASDESSVHELTALVEQDPSLTVSLLKLANSAWYGGVEKRIVSVEKAITRVGYRQVRNLALSIGIIRKFPQSFDLLDHRTFWNHSLDAACLATVLGRCCRAFSGEEWRGVLFVSGLLHDIGILVLDQFFHDTFEDVLSHTLNAEKSYLAAEKEVLGGQDHPAVGSALLEIWKQAPRAVAGVRFHHDPRRAPGKYTDIAWLLYLCEFLLCNHGIGSFEGTIRSHQERPAGHLGVDPDAWPQLLEESQRMAAQMKIVIEEQTGALGPLRYV